MMQDFPVRHAIIYTTSSLSQSGDGVTDTKIPATNT